MEKLLNLISKFDIYINDVKIDCGNIEQYWGQRIDSLVVNTIEVKCKESTASVIYEEPFGCCGKVYIHHFDHKRLTPKATDDKVVENLGILLEFCEELAKYQNYSYIGFVHTSRSFPCIAGLNLYYKFFQFKNKRSGNLLWEMYKIL